MVPWDGRQQVNLSHGWLGPLLNLFLYLEIQTTYCKGQEELKHREGAILRAQNAAENTYVHYLSVLTCVGLVSGRTSSKPAPDVYFIILTLVSVITP